MTRNLLLQSALEVFEDKGYDAATVDDIVGRAAANRATFYLHFSSKAQVVLGLIEEINDQIVGSDVPRLTQVIADGDRQQIREFHRRRFDQWPRIMPTIVAANAAAAADSEVQAAVDSWHDTAIREIVAGLDAAGRFTKKSRHARAVAAFAQLEYFSRRWARHGWTGLGRAEALETLTDSWCFLLVDG